MIDYSKIISRKYKGSEYFIDGEEYSGLTWLCLSPKPSKNKLDSLWDEVQEEIATEEAKRIQAKQAILYRIGITEEELGILLD